MMRRLSIVLFASFAPALAWSFTSDPGPVKNVSLLNIYERSVEVLFDPPAQNAAEVKSYYIAWVSTSGVTVGSKMIPADPVRTAVHVQPLKLGQAYAISISPVDAEGQRGSQTLLTLVQPKGSYEFELRNQLTQNGNQGFIFLPQDDPPMMRPNIIKLNNDFAGSLNFGGDLKSNIFDFGSVANNRQDHWHWAVRQTGEGNITTRLKGSLYLGDQQIHSMIFDGDTGPLGQRAWYVVLTPAKMERFHLIPKGGEDGDDARNAWPLEQVRVKVLGGINNSQRVTATVSRYRNGLKIQQQTFNWRSKVYFNVRQRLKIDVSQKGITFFADVEYNNQLMPIGTFGTDLSNWTECYPYLVFGLYPDFENSRMGKNSFGANVMQDAFGLMHWGNFAFGSASQPPATELSYFKDPDLGTRVNTRVNGLQAFTINIDPVGPDVSARELVFTDATEWPICDKPDDAVLNALASAQVRINGTALPGKTLAQLRQDAPAYRYSIPNGVLQTGANTISITGTSTPLPLFAPHIDLSYPNGSPAIAAYNPPGISSVVDMMPDDSLLKGWSFPSVDFPVPAQAGGQLQLTYTADASHTMQTAGLVTAITSMTMTVDGAEYWVHKAADVGTNFNTGSLTLYTTDYADGYHQVVFHAHTAVGTEGFSNGSNPAAMQEYDFNRALLIYNGPAVNTFPTIENLTVTKTSGNNATPISVQSIAAPDATAYVQQRFDFDLSFDVVTEAFVQDVQLLYEDGAGQWKPVDKHKGGSVGEKDGHFAPAVAAVSPAGGNQKRFTFHWDYRVDAPKEKPFVYTDLDGPAIRYKLVAVNAGNHAAEFSFIYKLRDDTMAYFKLNGIPATVTLGQTPIGSLTLQNIGNTTWPGDGSFRLKNFMDDDHVLFGEDGIPYVGPAVPPQGLAVFQLPGPPLAPSEMDDINFVLTQPNEPHEIFASSAIAVAVVSGNNASFVSQSGIPPCVAPAPASFCAGANTSYMDPGISYPISVTMMNTGSTAWTKAGGYCLVPDAPIFNLTWDVSQVCLDAGDTIQPGQSKTFLIPSVAPGFHQVYTFQWKMSQFGAKFTEDFGQHSTTVRIQVGQIPNELEFLTDLTDQWVKPGQTATFWANVRAYPIAATYRWEKMDPPSVSNPNPAFVPIVGADGSSLTTLPVDLTAEGTQFKLHISTGPNSDKSQVAILHVSLDAPTVPPAPAKYNVTITNDVLAGGQDYVPRQVNLRVAKADGPPAEDLRLDMGYGNNPLPIGSLSQTLDPLQSYDTNLDMLGKVQHRQSFNVSIVIVSPDGTTERIYDPAVYTALLEPPSPPVLRLPDSADARTKVDMRENFIDPYVGSLNLQFNRTSSASGAPGYKAPSLTPSASAVQSLSAQASTLNFGSLNLLRGRYQVLGTNVDWVGNVSAPAEAFVNMLGDDLSGAVVYPNPWDVREHAGHLLKFGNLTNAATVKIYTVSGHWVRTLQAQAGMAEWDMKNDSGDLVASGLYVYSITNDQGDKARGKVVIIR